MWKTVGYLFICLMLVGAGQARAEDKGKGPVGGITSAVSSHLDDLLSKERSLLAEISKANDKAAAFNKRQGEVVSLVQQTITELRRQAGAKGNAIGPAEARLRALGQLLELDAAKEIRTLADFNAFLRHVGQIQASGEDDAAFKAKYKGQNEANQVITGFRNTYFDKSENARIEKGREDLVEVKVTNPTTLEANVGFKRQPVTPTESMKSIVEKLEATNKAFRGCPTPEKLRADLAVAGKLKAEQERIIDERTKSAKARQQSLGPKAEELRRIHQNMKYQVRLAFLPSGTKGKTPDLDSAKNVESEVVDWITGKVMSSGDAFNMNALTALDRVVDPRKSMYDPEKRWGKNWHREAGPKQQYEQDWAVVQRELEKNESVVRDVMQRHVFNEPPEKGGFSLSILQKAMREKGADFSLHINFDMFRSAFVGAWRLFNPAGRTVGDRTRETTELGNAITADHDAIADARRALEWHQERIAALTACQGELTAANDAVLGVRFRPVEGVDTRGERALEQAHGFYQAIQSRLTGPTGPDAPTRRAPAP